MRESRGRMRRHLKDAILNALAVMWRTGQEPANLEGLLLQFRHLDDMDGELTQVFQDARNQLREEKPKHTTSNGERDFVYAVRDKYSRLLQNFEQKHEKAWFEQLFHGFEESRARSQAEFESLGEQISRATSREELVELGRRRVELASLTGRTFVYENHCWLCKDDISSEINARCPKCHWYICSCGACGCQFERGKEWDEG